MSEATPPTYSRYEEIHWPTWIPVERATLLFVVRDGQILLIHKKRGLGAGKINGPGGRLEPGETPAECAVREVEEELITTPQSVRACGELKFQFTDGHSIHGFVFRADTCDREPQETDEANPLWVSLDDIPFDRMWEDDRIWIPLMLKETPFVGQFLFEGDQMRGYELELTASSG